MIINIGSQIDKIATHIASLSLGYPIYAGRPISPVAGKYGYFSMTANSEKVGDDSVGTRIKQAEFDFVLLGTKETPDVEIYDMVDALSNAFCLLTPGSRLDLPTVSPTFRIVSIQEGEQSGVLRDVNNVPYVICTYKLTYNYLYS